LTRSQPPRWHSRRTEATQALHVEHRHAAELHAQQPRTLKHVQRLMAAVDLLKRTRNPSEADIDAIENMCRCGTYGRIRTAIRRAAALMA
jgi:xanthine dehydrogenase iron-sulfur cluster and FAD-binding subunit A